MSPASQKIKLLHDRAAMLAQARHFFATRNVLEVDVPALTPCGSIDAHIDLVRAQLSHHPRYYLHSSPEYGMKILLSQGIGDIYQLSHVFRDGEWGERHLPEFMMVEWYRHGFSLAQLIAETADFLELFVGPQQRVQLTYRQALLRYAGVDGDAASIAQLVDALKLPDAPQDRQTLCQLLLACVVEPQLTGDTIYAITDFPADQAALARTTARDGVEVAERFELFYQGNELANGYHELADPVEQQHRFERSNAQRVTLGKEPYPIDEQLIAALEQGLPDCCGVAVGFDRLMMCRHQAEEIGMVSHVLTKT